MRQIYAIYYVYFFFALHWKEKTQNKTGKLEI